MNKFLSIVFICLVSLVACSPSDNDTGNSSSDNPNNIQSDQQIRLSPDAFGCEYLSIFVDAANHYARNEINAWVSEIRPDNGCFSDLSGKLVWTALQIRGPYVQVGFTTLSQYESAENVVGPEVAKNHYWTFASWAVPAHTSASVAASKK